MDKPHYLTDEEWENLFYWIGETRSKPFYHDQLWKNWIDASFQPRYRLPASKTKLLKQDFKLMCFANDFIEMEKL